MARRRYLVAYDIADPVRLRTVCTLIEEYGERLQYSVFVCDLSAAEHVEMIGRVTAAMNLAADSIVHIDLGPTSSPAQIRSIGRPKRLPGTGPVII